VRTVTVAAGRLEGWLAGFADRHGAPTVSRGERVVELVGVDGAQARIEVPFPPLRGELVAHVLRPRRIGVLLVRRHGHAVGVFDGTNLVASKVGSAYVQGGTKAGGWSQQRYARRRANQASAAFAQAATPPPRSWPTSRWRPCWPAVTGPRCARYSPTGAWHTSHRPRPG